MRVRNIAAAVLAVATLGFAAPALAVDATAEAGDWQIGVRAVVVIPDESGSLSIGGDVEVDLDTKPEFDVTYFINSNWALELIATTTQHDVMATAGGGTDLGNVWLLPPTLLVQYRFDTSANWQPYLGAGLNYTVFYNEETPGGFKIDYSDEFGFALQMGADIFVDEHWLINLDVKHIFLNSDVNVANGAVTGNVTIDPWIVGVGLGYRF